MARPRKAWAGFVDKRLRPTIMQAAREHAGHKVQRLLGFWVAYHYWGGQDGVLDSGLWNRNTYYRQRNEFLDTFGVDVADAWPEARAGLVHIDGYRGADHAEV